jgi:site-specific recombinase XerD
MTDIMTYQAQTDLIPHDADKDTASRLGRYQDWITDQGQAWHDPDLAGYRDYLLDQDLAASSVSAHLSTIRGRYQTLLKDNGVRDGLEVAIREALANAGKPDDPANVEALVNRKLTRLSNAIDPSLSKVKVHTDQDTPDSQHHRLTAQQAEHLLQAPDTSTLQGLRDKALFALMLSTGIRAAEAAALEVEDLRQQLGGELALHVKAGKGDKGRLVPYGDMDQALIVVDAWLDAAGITEGPVFRGFYRGYKTIRDDAITTRGIEKILEGYQVPINGELVTLAPHDLRRSYARLLYTNGVDLISIQQNLGHADSKTTLGYIGVMDASARRPPAMINFYLTGR